MLTGLCKLLAGCMTLNRDLPGIASPSQAEEQEPMTEHISAQGRHFPYALPFISDIKPQAHLFQMIDALVFFWTNEVPGLSHEDGHYQLLQDAQGQPISQEGCCYKVARALLSLEPESEGIIADHTPCSAVTCGRADPS